MHIIIDGYNVIRQSDALRRFERSSLETGRNALIHRVSLYKKIKGHPVTIVFDGWDGGSATEQRDRQEGIEIIFSPRGEKADEVIKRMAATRNKETIVVTSDRDIADYVNHGRGTAISSQEFEIIMDRIIAAAEAPNRYVQTGGKDQKQYEEEDDDRKKKGASRRLSRKKKAIRAALHKL